MMPARMKAPADRYCRAVDDGPATMAGCSYRPAAPVNPSDDAGCEWPTNDCIISALLLPDPMSASPCSEEDGDKEAPSLPPAALCIAIDSATSCAIASELPRNRPSILEGSTP